MAERDSAPPPPPPPPPDVLTPASLNVHDPASSESPPVFEPGTYVVQVPKDQIYRIPPPENARFLLQLQQNPEQKKQRSYCSCRNCCSCCFVVVILIIVVGFAVGLSFALSKSRNPDSRLQHFVVKSLSSTNQSHDNHDYDLKLQVHNYPNVKSQIPYKKGGVASLFFRQQKLAEGEFPIFHQDDHNSTEIAIALKGLIKNISHSIKNAEMKLHVSFPLKTINVPAKMKISSFKNGHRDTELLVTCRFMVDTLAAETRILTQQCQTNR